MAGDDLLNRTDAFVASERDRRSLACTPGRRRRPPAGGRAAPAGGRGPTVVPRDLDVATISPVIVDAIRRVGRRRFSGLAVPVPTPADLGAARTHGP